MRKTRSIRNHLVSYAPLTSLPVDCDASSFRDTENYTLTQIKHIDKLLILPLTKRHTPKAHIYIYTHICYACVFSARAVPRCALINSTQTAAAAGQDRNSRNDSASLEPASCSERRSIRRVTAHVHAPTASCSNKERSLVLCVYIAGVAVVAVVCTQVTGALLHTTRPQRA